MEFESLFRHFWWLIFPLFGMLMGIWGMILNGRRSRDAMSLIKSYVDQGKDPPPELIHIAAGSSSGQTNYGQSRRGSWSWLFVVFAAVSAGFGVAYFSAHVAAPAFLIVSVIMGVIAFGALLMALFGEQSER